MADKSGIEWTDATWNPVVGCTRVSEGCRNCYAETLSARFSGIVGHKFEGIAHRFSPIGTDLGQGQGDGAGQVKGNSKGEARWTGLVKCIEGELATPLKWRKPRRIFVNSVSDSFHEKVPFEFLDRMWAVMALCPQHVFQVLTKRPERMVAYFADGGRAFRWVDAMRTLPAFPKNPPTWLDWPLPNVWLGTSVENQECAEERIPWLLRCPAAVRFLSCEPLLGAVDLGEWIDGKDGKQGRNGIDWVIAGGESSAGRPGARPCHPDWVRGIRDQCVGAGVPFFFKQWGDCETFYDRDVEDPDWRRCPDVKHPGEQYLNLEGGQGFHGTRVVAVRRVGKKKAGRVLDGRVWDEMPGQRAATDLTD
jgi:protein gp37